MGHPLLPGENRYKFTQSQIHYSMRQPTMTPSAPIQKLLTATTSGAGLSAEMGRFSAGMRVITALLCTTLILSTQSSIDVTLFAVLLVYCLWSGWLLWVAASGRGRRSALWSYWIDVAWSLMIMKLWSAGALLMLITLVQPVVLASIGYGVTQGLLLSLLATLGLIAFNGSELMSSPSLGWQQNMQTLIMLALAPAAALVALPMGIRFRWSTLLSELEAQLDPRRGLDPICAELVERLRKATQADVVALVLPSSQGAPAMIASREEGSFRASAAVHARLENLLSQTPACPVGYVRRPWWDPRPSMRLLADLPLPADLSPPLAELALTLDVRHLDVVPLTRYARRHGHIVLGFAGKRGAVHDVSALADLAPELLRVVEQAALVDQLQEESAGHERARIGRDLHDSAIQPYLGLKYAVESVALRIPLDNPARAEVDSLAQLVNGEVSALRELISGLRTGKDQGDNALVPAVRRQVRRFSVLFGIDIVLDCPDNLPTTRAMASSLFHMVNEVLNNIRKHTAARHIWITLSVQASTIRLLVRDDAGSIQGRPAGDFRPVSLSERTAELNGTLHISHPDELNTELVIQVPL
jgi:signal transduction histidine kinase